MPSCELPRRVPAVVRRTRHRLQGFGTAFSALHAATVGVVQAQDGCWPAFHNLPASAQDVAAASAIPSAINHHVRNLPQGVFTNMDLEVEEVKFTARPLMLTCGSKAPT